MATEEIPQIKIKMVRSIIDRPLKQKRSMKALGLKRLHQSVVKKATPQILGILKKVKHLVRVEPISNNA